MTNSNLKYKKNFIKLQKNRKQKIFMNKLTKLNQKKLIFY